MIFLTILGKVKAKQSFKFTRYGGKYTPADVKEYAKHIRGCFYAKYPEFEPLEGALRVTIDVFVKIPKSFSKKKTEQAQYGEVRPTVKPDCDNICKNLLDSLNGVAYKDDKQIVEVHIKKFYADIELVQITIDKV